MDYWINTHIISQFTQFEIPFPPFAPDLGEIELHMAYLPTSERLIVHYSTVTNLKLEDDCKGLSLNKLRLWWVSLLELYVHGVLLVDSRQWENHETEKRSEERKETMNDGKIADSVPRMRAQTTECTSRKSWSSTWRESTWRRQKFWYSWCRLSETSEWSLEHGKFGCSCRKLVVGQVPISMRHSGQGRQMLQSLRCTVSRIHRLSPSAGWKIKFMWSLFEGLFESAGLHIWLVVLCGDWVQRTIRSVVKWNVCWVWTVWGERTKTIFIWREEKFVFVINCLPTDSFSFWVSFINFRSHSFKHDNNSLDYAVSQRSYTQLYSVFEKWRVSNFYTFCSEKILFVSHHQVYARSLISDLNRKITMIQFTFNQQPLEPMYQQKHTMNMKQTKTSEFCTLNKLEVLFDRRFYYSKCKEHPESYPESTEHPASAITCSCSHKQLVPVGLLSSSHFVPSAHSVNRCTGAKSEMTLTSRRVEVLFVITHTPFSLYFLPVAILMMSRHVFTLSLSYRHYIVISCPPKTHYIGLMLCKQKLEKERPRRCTRIERVYQRERSRESLRTWVSRVSEWPLGEWVRRTGKGEKQRSEESAEAEETQGRKGRGRFPRARTADRRI